MSDNNNLAYFEIFPWDKNFETGISLIDKQHRVLVNILNKLANSLANVSNEVVLNEIFDELTSYTDYHFKTEEGIWAKYLKKDKAFLEHQKTHENFINNLIKLKNKQLNKSFDENIYDIVNFLSKWLAYHILDTDKRLSFVVKYLDKGFSLEEAKEKANKEMEGLMEVLVNTVLTMYENLSNRTLDLMREKALRLKVEKSLKRNEERWKLILDGGLENVWDFYLDINDFKIENNAYFEDLFNEKVIKNKQFMRIEPSDIKKLKIDFLKHLEGETKYFESKFRLLTHDDSWHWLQSRGKIVSHEGSVCRLVGTNSDITEKELATVLYKNSSQAMMVTDYNNQIINVNPAFTKTTGYKLEEVIGLDPKFLSSKEHPQSYFKNLWSDLDEHSYFNGEIVNKKKNGELFTSIININAIKNETGILDHYVALFTDISKKKLQDDEVIKQASYDNLTNLYNRRIFELQLKQEIFKSNRTIKPFALFFMDLDYFKVVNDDLGHEIGDLVLIEVSKRVQKQIRESDILCRFGGDEFTIILPDIENLQSLGNIADTIIEEIEKPIIINSYEIEISVSIGIAIYPNDGKSKAELIKHADYAMYEAKKEGRGRYQYYLKSMKLEALKNKEIIQGLKAAIDSEEFEIYYQPIIDLKTKKLVKAEALLRWNRPNYGLTYPKDFMSFAQKSSLMLQISDWVYEHSLKQSQIWHEKYNKDIQIGINNSISELKVDVDEEEWFEAFEEFGLSGKSINIEIKEEALDNKNENIKNRLLKMSNKGIEIAIDNFGLGGSSLSKLKDCKIKYVKIDKSFVSNMENSKEDVSICEALVVMAHKLGIEVIAQGVENAKQREILTDINCDYAQGFYFSKPLNVKDFEEKYLKD